MKKWIAAAVVVVLLSVAGWRYFATRERRRVKAALAMAGLEVSDAKVDLMLPGARTLLESYAKLREAKLPNDAGLALVFSALPRGEQLETGASWVVPAPRGAHPPADVEQLAFATVAELSQLLRTKLVTSEALTKMYLARLKKFDPQLHAVVTLLEDRALRDARAADAEIAAGKWRGPLHGIPYGAKDLIAAKGAPTTWGSVAYKDQVIDKDAAVIESLSKAGAVLVAKLSLGELAWGDVWFGGTTRNPWKVERGSSGSSAGPAAAVSAGLVPFALGSETLGSIMSPSAECGVTGLRPTFGRVSRAGAMALSFSLDRLGPLCRTAEDCALVLDAIRGADAGDPGTVDAPLRYRPRADLRGVRIGVLREPFNRDHAEKDADLAALEKLKSLGAALSDFAPPKLPYQQIRLMLDAEAAAAFDELTRSGREDLLVRQIENAWPNVFRRAHLIPAVEYVQASRLRALLVEDLAARMKDLDAIVAPTRSELIAMSGYPGLPAVAVVDGFTKDGLPASLTFAGHPFREGELLAIAQAYEDAAGYFKKQPPVGALR